MIVFKQMPLRAGDVVAYHEFNAEFQSLAGEMNGGIDRENFTQHQVRGVMVAPGTTAIYETADGTPTAAYTATGEWTVLTRINVAGPGRLITHAMLTMSDNGAASSVWALGIKYQGRIIADTGYDNYGSVAGVNWGWDRQTKTVSASPFVRETDVDVWLCIRAPANLTAPITKVSMQIHGVMRRR